MAARLWGFDSPRSHQAAQRDERLPNGSRSFFGFSSTNCNSVEERFNERSSAEALAEEDRRKGGGGQVKMDGIMNNATNSGAVLVPLHHQ